MRASSSLIALAILIAPALGACQKNTSEPSGGAPVAAAPATPAGPSFNPKAYGTEPYRLIIPRNRVQASANQARPVEQVRHLPAAP